MLLSTTLLDSLRHEASVGTERLLLRGSHGVHLVVKDWLMCAKVVAAFLKLIDGCPAGGSWPGLIELAARP